MGQFLAVQTDAELEYEMRIRNRPWTRRDYERLRQTVITMVRTNRPLDMPDGSIRTSVDGPAFWAVLGALDRKGREENE